MDRVIRIGLLGCGTVGAGVVTILDRGADDVTARTGARLQITRVAVRDATKVRDLPLPQEIYTEDAMAVVEADDVDLIIEVMGGRDLAATLMRRALELGKPVVTANKELIAHEGPELAELARTAGVDLAFEAAVAGAIPIIKPLKESLAGDRITRVVGILNGTTNYILTRMTEEGAAYTDVLAEAQALGYAEADPTADVGGHDAAAKAAIIASLAFDTTVHAADVFREGIESVSATDIEVADRLGYVIKLLGIASEVDDRVAVRVHPTFLPKEHPLAGVRESFNAIYVEAEAAGELMFYGRGAGSLPTGSAVVGDVIDVARNLMQTARGPIASDHRAKPLRPIEDLQTQYYVLLAVADEPGVLAEVARTFGDHDVSIAQVWQEGSGDTAQLVLITHRSREGDLRACVESLEASSCVRKVTSVLRVESEVWS
ncbi:homoserine dehydrogenase [Nitriliruptor alkaliphilus]|uniref:homoserine dehydrogenase n=1 Tax=Nitriliruptor alkaliphilus TaxID=427918 RepID=UPI0006968323|nr:homoserine dehydrogenase [Nitriliruptor alkaliphilus]